MPVTIYSFYHFASLPDYLERADAWRAECKQLGLKGTILVAEEGINASLSGEVEALDAFLASLTSDKRFAGMPHKLNHADEHPFKRMLVRLKKEIIKMGMPLGLDTKRGDYLEGEAWDKLISDPETIVVDTRNDYEVALGTFEKALDPQTFSFSQFPEWVEKNLDAKKHKKVAMFCTGGIRCEKSTAYLKAKGFDEVYHLKGGILQYLADTKNKNGKWKGECYVFDDRVAVDDTLTATGRRINPKTGKPVV